jgi:hypothetical protein
LRKLQRTRLSRKGTPSAVRVLRSREWVHVWFCEAGKLRKLTGMLRIELALDAMRHGQDLVDDLVDQSLKEAERRSTGAHRPHLSCADDNGNAL